MTTAAPKYWKTMFRVERIELLKKFGWTGLESHAFYGPQIKSYYKHAPMYAAFKNT